MENGQTSSTSMSQQITIDLEAFLDIQKDLAALRHLYEDLTARQTASKEDLQKVSLLVDKIFKDLYVGNGEDSFKQQIKNVAISVNNLTTSIDTERKKREAKEQKEEKSKDKWFWAFMAILLPAALWFVWQLIFLVTTKGLP